MSSADRNELVSLLVRQESRSRLETISRDRDAAVTRRGHDDAETTANMRDRSAIVEHCLSKLSPLHREVLDLVYYHEKSVDEVAQIVGAPASTVKTRMFYARKRMENLLKATGLDAH
jgi:RNA polymerase sigma-70 factor (ECF subfamily)